MAEFKGPDAKVEFLLLVLRECITDDNSRAMTDESRDAVSTARRRLNAINELARRAIAKAGA